MNDLALVRRGRGRPPKSREDSGDTRQLLLSAGIVVLTERAFSATGIDELLRSVGVPKGSFYHYFQSKEEFGLRIIEQYSKFFVHKLRGHFRCIELTPINRVRAFIEDAEQGMTKFEYRRGCLIGNLGQEMGSLPESFRAELKSVFESWQHELAVCLTEAQSLGEVDPLQSAAMLAEYFWIGWEGAVLRAKLERTNEPLKRFAEYYLASIRPR